MKRLLSSGLILAAFTVALAGDLGAVTGRVVNAVTGDPISGATVKLQTANSRPVQVTTNDRGVYAARNLEPGQYRVTANARGFEPAAWPEPVAVRAGQVVEDINFRLRPARPDVGAIAGRVLDRITGEPVPGAVVAARGRGGAGKGVTDRHGSYVIRGLPAGEYALKAKARHYLKTDYPGPVTVRAGEVTEDINFGLVPKPRKGAIAGRVVNARTGEPVASALVTAIGEGDAGRCVTNARGVYRIKVRPGPYRVNCRARGFEPETFPRPVPVRPGAVTDGIDFELHRSTTQTD
jgi:protocatechuate 3,4-dioxygenase beta subunit